MLLNAVTNVINSTCASCDFGSALMHRHPGTIVPQNCVSLCEGKCDKLIKVNISSTEAVLAYRHVTADYLNPGDLAVMHIHGEWYIKRCEADFPNEADKALLKKYPECYRVKCVIPA